MITQSQAYLLVATETSIQCNSDVYISNKLGDKVENEAYHKCDSSVSCCIIVLMKRCRRHETAKVQPRPANAIQLRTAGIDARSSSIA